MHPITRILCPVDLSLASAGALKYADVLARACGARLVVLHAFDLPETLDVPGQTHPADPDVERHFHEFTKLSPGVEVERILHAGSPGEVICWAAAKRGCDLIVMGTHGRTGLMHLLLGSVTEHVVRHAQCPVLTVRHQLTTDPEPVEPLVVPLPAPSMM